MYRCSFDMQLKVKVENCVVISSCSMLIDLFFFNNCDYSIASFVALKYDCCMVSGQVVASQPYLDVG